jgi:hypothetical protein
MNSAGKTLQWAEEDCTVKLAVSTTMEILLEIKEQESSMKEAYNVLVDKPAAKRTVGRTKRR